MSAAPTEVAVRETVVAVRGQCSRQTALNLTREIKRSLEQSWVLIKEAFDRRAWAALGYDSWESYCRKEFGTHLTRLSKELRREAVAALATGDQPMSNRAIAAAIGVDEGTVRNDLRTGAEFSAAIPVKGEVRTEASDEQFEGERPQDEQPKQEPVKGQQPKHEPAEGGEDDEYVPAPTRRVTGVDGRGYSTKPQSKRRRRPLPEQFLRAAVNLDKAAQDLVRLTEDDRFRTHAPALGGRGEIQRAAEAIRTVLDALAEAGNG